MGPTQLFGDFGRGEKNKTRNFVTLDRRAIAGDSGGRPSIELDFSVEVIAPKSQDFNRQVRHPAGRSPEDGLSFCLC
jgi:hypothetical protein